jgi:siroheme synthase
MKSTALKNLKAGDVVVDCVGRNRRRVKWVQPARARGYVVVQMEAVDAGVHSELLRYGGHKDNTVFVVEEA